MSCYPPKMDFFTHSAFYVIPKVTTRQKPKMNLQRQRKGKESIPVWKMMNVQKYTWTERKRNYGDKNSKHTAIFKMAVSMPSSTSSHPKCEWTEFTIQKIQSGWMDTKTRPIYMLRNIFQI